MSSKTPVFEATVTAAGRLRFTEDERLKLDSYVSTLAGERVDVIVKKHAAKRSLDQNAYLHAEPFPKIADAMGDSVEGAKYVLMGECWGWKYSEAAKREVPVQPSTSSMTVPQCTQFIDWLIPFAADMWGLQILLPDEWERRQAA
jgi:hypothetical protein